MSLKKVSRFFIHFSALLVLTLIPDHYMRIHYDRVPVWFPPALYGFTGLLYGLLMASGRRVLHWNRRV